MRIELFTSASHWLESRCWVFRSDGELLSEPAGDNNLVVPPNKPPQQPPQPPPLHQAALSAMPNCACVRVSVLSARRQSLSPHCSLPPTSHRQPLQLSPVVRVAAPTRRPALPTTPAGQPLPTHRLSLCTPPSPLWHSCCCRVDPRTSLTHLPPVMSLPRAPVEAGGPSPCWR